MLAPRNALLDRNECSLLCAQKLAERFDEFQLLEDSNSVALVQMDAQPYMAGFLIIVWKELIRKQQVI